jgi:predicted nuclease with TOPRIM domain
MARESQAYCLQERLDESLEENVKLRGLNQNLREENEELNDQLETTQSSLAKMTDQVKMLQIEISEKKEEIKYLQGQMEELVAEVDSLKKDDQGKNLGSVMIEVIKSQEQTPLRLVQDMKDRLKVSTSIYDLCRILKKKSVLSS